mgnify:FL=1|jgi:hypothetical protein
MIKLIVTFIVAYTIFHIGIHTFISLSDADKWSLTKTVAYSILCSLITIVTLTTIVILF